MISHQKHVSVVTLVAHANKSVRIMKGAVGNPQTIVRHTVTKSGVFVHLHDPNALVARTVVHVRESVRKMMDVASRIQDGANETVKKGLE